MVNKFLIVGLATVGVSLIWLNVYRDVLPVCTTFEVDGITAQACTTPAQAARLEDSLQAMGDRMAAGIERASKQH